MNFMDFSGNEVVKSQLSFAFRSGHLYHSYIISGPAGSGKSTLANILSAAMLCSGDNDVPCGRCSNCKKSLRGLHPDIRIIDSDNGREIPVDRVRELISSSAVLPNEASKSVYIIKNADLMNISAQNAALKLLEEPPAHAFFILLCENSLKLLQTIRSRCMELKLSPLSEAQLLPILTRRFPDADTKSLRRAASSGFVGTAIAALNADSENSALSRDFLSLVGSKDAAALTEFSANLSGLDRNAFSDFLDQSEKLFAAHVLTSASSGQSLLPEYSKILDLIKTLHSYVQVNVGIGHLAGYLLEELVSINEKIN